MIKPQVSMEKLGYYIFMAVELQKADKVEDINDIELPLIIEDRTLMDEGVWNDNFYSRDEIKKAYKATDWDSKEVTSLFLNHDDRDAGAWVGQVINPHLEGNKLTGDLKIVDEPVARKLVAGAKFGISPKVIGDSPTNSKEMRDFTYENFSIVTNPAVKTAYINNSEKVKEGVVNSEELDKYVYFINDKGNLCRLERLKMAKEEKAKAEEAEKEKEETTEKEPEEAPEEKKVEEAEEKESEPEDTEDTEKDTEEETEENKEEYKYPYPYPFKYPGKGAEKDIFTKEFAKFLERFLEEHEDVEMKGAIKAFEEMKEKEAEREKMKEEIKKEMEEKLENSTPKSKKELKEETKEMDMDELNEAMHKFILSNQ